MLFDNKKNIVNIALDCAGGDHAPAAIIQGASIISEKLKNTVKFHFFGDESAINNLLKTYKIKSKYEITHCSSFIPNDAKPSAILRAANREYKNSSMILAIRSVKDLKNDAIISAGNTGALMVLSRSIIGTLPTIDRPAIISLLPNDHHGNFVILDIGANVGCTTEDLLQFSIMGAAFARTLLNKPIPNLALLNIGEEENKGNDTIKNTYKILKHTDNDLFKFNGYIEPNNIFKGDIDVVVCDGFIGNVALKSTEGAVNMIRKYLHNSFKKSWITKLAYFLMKNTLKKEMSAMDPRATNAGMFIGLNGIVVKSHGFSDGIAISNSIRITHQLVFDDINNKIIKEIEEYDLDFEEQNLH